MTGQPWRAVPSTRPDLIDAERMADAQHRTLPPFFYVVMGAQFLLYVLALLLRRRWRLVFTAYAAVPAATFLAHLVPWWRHGFAFLLADVAAWALAITAIAYAGPWRRRPLGPPGAVAAMTAAVIGTDLLTGAHLQLGSVAGYSPLVAGRFAGIGNPAFAVFGTAAVLAAAAFAAGRPRRQAVVAVVVAGVVAVAVDGAPMWGSDLGGVLALVAGFAVLEELVRRGRVSWRRLLLAGVAAVAIVAVFALADYARPPEVRTHLGRFVASVRDGRAGAIVARKARANYHLLTHSVLTLLAPTGVAGLGYLVVRPIAAFRARPALRAGLLAVLALNAVGFLVNDSGVAVPAMSLTVALPIAFACLGKDPEEPVLP